MRKQTTHTEEKLHGPLDNCCGWSPALKTLPVSDAAGRSIAIVVGSGNYRISNGRLAEIEAAYATGSR